MARCRDNVNIPLSVSLPICNPQMSMLLTADFRPACQEKMLKSVDSNSFVFYS